VNETREELLHRDLENVVARAKARGSSEEEILAAVRRSLRKRRRAR
jgi:DNA-binding transcriptional regulator YhcF (GntR family)